jgi:hypothetical protein
MCASFCAPFPWGGGIWGIPKKRWPGGGGGGRSQQDGCGNRISKHKWVPFHAVLYVIYDAMQCHFVPCLVMPSHTMQNKVPKLNKNSFLTFGSKVYQFPHLTARITRTTLSGTWIDQCVVEMSMTMKDENHHSATHTHITERNHQLGESRIQTLLCLKHLFQLDSFSHQSQTPNFCW